MARDDRPLLPQLDLQADRNPVGSGVTFRASEQLGDGVKYAGLVWVPQELLEDAAGGTVETFLTVMLDRRFRPWRYPDRNPFPTITPLPRLVRLTKWADHLAWRIHVRRDPSWLYYP